MDNPGSVNRSFEGVSFRVNYNNQEAAALIRFLLGDLPPLEPSDVSIKEFDLLFAGKAPYVSLWDADKKLYHGTSRYRVAYTLINLILFYSIAPHVNHHALHAGAVHKGSNAVILPGQSGAGKSTLTGWLLTRGYHYLTDELVMLSNVGQIRAFPRPLSFKEGGVESFLPHFKEKEKEQIIRDEEGAIVPHRLLNPEYLDIKPMLTLVIFPRFQQGADIVLEELSPARSCLQLLRCHVNGRNLDDLGVHSLSAILRGCRSYSLTYGKFEGLQQIFDDLLQS